MHTRPGKDEWLTAIAAMVPEDIVSYYVDEQSPLIPPPDSTPLSVLHRFVETTYQRSTESKSLPLLNILHNECIYKFINIAPHMEYMKKFGKLSFSDWVRNYLMFQLLLEAYPEEYSNIPDYDFWMGLLTKPADAMLIDTIDVILKNREVWTIVKDRLRHLDPGDEFVMPLDNSLVLANLKRLGVRKIDIAKIRCPNSKIPPNQLVNLLTWSDGSSVFGRPTHLSRYLSGTMGVDLDVCMWVMSHRGWHSGSTWFEHKGRRIYIHHHNLLPILTLPIIGNKVNVKVNPSSWIRQAKQEELSLLLDKHLESLLIPFFRPKGLAIFLEQYPHLTFIPDGEGLVNEGIRMNNCIGGFNYRKYGQSGSALFFHYAKGERELSIHIQRVVGDTAYTWVLREVKSFNNGEPTHEETQYAEEIARGLTLISIIDQMDETVKNV